MRTVKPVLARLQDMQQGPRSTALGGYRGWNKTQSKSPPRSVFNVKTKVFVFIFLQKFILILRKKYSDRMCEWLFKRKNNGEGTFLDEESPRFFTQFSLEKFNMAAFQCDFF